MLLKIALFRSFYGRVVFCYIYVLHTLFINSSVNGHLVCFHILAIVNNAVWT